MALFDGSNLSGRQGLTFLVLSVGPDLWPHAAILSASEVYAPNRAEIRLAFWLGSNTTANLTRVGTAVLMAIDSGAAYFVRLHARRAEDLKSGIQTRALFKAQVEDVLEDAVGYATITGGISFRLNDPERDVAAREAAVSAMRTASRPPRQPTQQPTAIGCRISSCVDQVERLCVTSRKR
jgi:hypothetical protein